MSHLQLAGEVDTRAEETRLLREELEAALEQLRATKLELAQVRAENVRAVSKLRQQLAPLYTALQHVFGEIDSIAPADTATAPAGGQPADPRWQSWKQRMPGRPAEMIELLLVHGSMSVKNLMAAMHCGKDAVYQAASKLGQAGVVVNNNGRYSLKP